MIVCECVPTNYTLYTHVLYYDDSANLFLHPEKSFLM